MAGRGSRRLLQGNKIALDFDLTTIRDDAGKAAILPCPHGMSGRGIWRLVEAGTDARLSKFDDIKLVAI
jgi:hypothetical protein